MIPTIEQYYLIKDDVFLVQPVDSEAISIKAPSIVQPDMDELPTRFLIFDDNNTMFSHDIVCDLSMACFETLDKSTIFQELTRLGIDWCRYCGTTEGVNWRPGPWGKRTLCNKHGCDYKGYGLASRLPRLDLSLFQGEKERTKPVLQYFCYVCQVPDTGLVACCGCSRAYHPSCYPSVYSTNSNSSSSSSSSNNWYCSTACKTNRQQHKVVIDLPRKYIPRMHLLSKFMLNN